MTTITTSKATSSFHPQPTPAEPLTQSATEYKLETGTSVRLACRSGSYTSPTPGLANGYVQANLLILPAPYASDFRNLCTRNPVPCPLLAESIAPGRFDRFKSHIPGVSDDQLFVAGTDRENASIDIRTDLPRYNVYRAGALVKQGVTDVRSHWTTDHVAFLIGCSFSFEAALADAGLTPRHVEMGRNVPMYRTSVPLCPAGVFTGGRYVVSMRPYQRVDINRVRDITGAYGVTHGEPVDWGWDALERLEIRDVDRVQWGESVMDAAGRGMGELRRERLERVNAGAGIEKVDVEGWDEEVPVFWGCGVTPQEAVMKAGSKIEGTVIGHMPGHMLVMDVMDGQIVSTKT